VDLSFMPQYTLNLEEVRIKPKKYWLLVI
jgi:hypothetical protein